MDQAITRGSGKGQWGHSINSDAEDRCGKRHFNQSAGTSNKSKEMIQDYFELSEVLCPEVCKKYGDFAWQFFDIRLLIVMESIRMRLNKPIYVNDYSVHGKLT